MSYNKLDDSSLFPMGEVPDDYFLYLWNNSMQPGNVKDYIRENLEAIKENVKRSKR